MAPSVTVRALVAIEGVGLGALVIRDGRPLWLVVRVVLVAAVCWWAMTSSRPAVRVVVGFVGGTACAVVTVAYLSHAGVALLPIVAGVAAVSGLVLGGWSTVIAVRSRRGWRRALPVLGVLALAQVVLLPLLTAVHATNVPPTRLGERTPADVGLPHEDVQLRAGDGVQLAGWYIPSTNGAAVVLRHGAGSTRTAVLDEAAVLGRAGFGVLMLDARGHGESGGDAMDLGWFGARDIAAAVDWLVERPGVGAERIALVGSSMGGEEALTAAAADERIRAVVAEGATQRVPDDARWERGGVAPLRATVTWVTFALTDVLTSASPPVPLRDAVEAISPRPVLLIAGAPRGELEASERYRRAAPDAVTVWHLPDTPHTDGLQVHPEEWEDRVTSFLDAAIGEG